MLKYLIIARSNIKKAKGQTAAIIVLIILAAILVNLWFMLGMDYKENFKRQHDRLNAQHVTLSVSQDSGVNDFLTETLNSDGRVDSYLLSDCLQMTGTMAYREGEMNSWFVFSEAESALSRSIGRVEITKQGELTSGVYLPLIYENEEIAVGKPIKMSIGGKEVEFMILGFFNSVMTGSHNCYMTEFLLTKDKYEEFKLLNYAAPATFCSVRLKNVDDALNFSAELNDKVRGKFPTLYTMVNNYEEVVEARYISQMICVGIIAAMAFFVLIIALAVISSDIANFIHVNMKNLGALKAVGYTSNQLIAALLLQFTGLTVVSFIVGTALSYILLSLVNSMMIYQTGIPYAVKFLPLPALMTFLICTGSVAFFVWASAKKIGKVEPIVALRQGVKTHNFKKNHVPLDKAKMPVNFALALKNSLSMVKQNFTIAITMFVLSLVIAFSGLMTRNVIVDMQPFIDLIVGEVPESCIAVAPSIEEEFLKAIEKDERVEKAYLYTSLNVSHVNGAGLVVSICDDFNKVTNKGVVFKGRFPEYDNEIALAAKYAKEMGFNIGEEIEISAKGKSENYLICGLTQLSNQLGKDCLMTRKGYERLSKIESLSYYFDLDDSVDIDEFNNDYKEKFAESVFATINGKTTIEGMAVVYVSLLKIIVVAILVISAVIIAFVLYLLVRTMLNSKKADYGILKSLGFTTRQLVVQTALSFMPSIIIFSVLGLTISTLIINPLTALFLSGIGIVKCTFILPIGFIIASGIALIGLSFLIACINSFKIKNMPPVALFTE